MNLVELSNDFSLNYLACIRRTASEFKLSLSQSLCLQSIPFDGISQSQLAKKLSIDISTLSRNITHLISLDIVSKKHYHIDIVFEDKSILRYCDPRRFGCFLWTENIDNHFLIENLGPEPLGNSFNGEYLFNLSRKRKVPIKNFIMN